MSRIRPPRPSRIPADRPVLIPRRPSLSLPPIAGSSSSKPPANTNPHRASKLTQKLVFLPSDPQTKPLLSEIDEDAHGYETDAGVRMREHKSEGERMSKAERRRAGYRRITAYCVADGLKMKFLASFLKREHNVMPRVFDEALYVMYHLPLLPGYGPTVNIRSSVPAQDRHLSRMSEAEENGYQGTYFGTSASETPFSLHDGYIPSSSPLQNLNTSRAHPETETEAETTEIDEPSIEEGNPAREGRADKARALERERVDSENVAEAVFFAYGVIVFFGLDEEQERSILEDVEGAGAIRRKLPEADWEVEECHYAYDPTIAYPRIYNDFFTFKSPSHLLTLSISHALAQSTLLAHYESLAHAIFADPRTTSIPRQLASTGALNLSRTQAMRLTGRLFRLRRDVVLGGNVLDVPELFWSEASMRGLYDAVRSYLEIGERVGSLNDRLVGANDLLDAIHDHLNNNAMERITWIIIWLIVVAIMVELGEVIARLIVHATTVGSSSLASASPSPSIGMLSISPEEALRSVESMIGDL